jgi:WD40 repeat protein/transcriptional regulator with XRE-family HTH domain
VKRSSYRERDYAFGQQMLARRMATGLTQAELADLLGVSRHAVGGWESGQSYPTADRLKAFITLCLQQHVFTEGNAVEEIRTLWRAAHQKVLLDDLWLHELLSQQASPRVEVAGEPTRDTDRANALSSVGEPQVDWGDALDVPTFYGREEELAQLSRWVVEERCRVVSVLGMGGIGKSALAVTLMHQIAAQFEVVIWRSLRDAPACATLLDECLQVLAPHLLLDKPGSLEGRLNVLMEQVRARRVLLVLDNLEMLLEEGDGMGGVRAGFEEYARLLRRLGETAHQSCLLLTSREKPAELVPLEGSRSSVRALRLAGLDAHAGVRVLAEKDVVSSLPDRTRLVETYQGNPLALKIVAQTIVELFGGEIVPFLEQGEVVFGGVRELLDEQFDRLSVLEQTVFFWLAILREPVSLKELHAVLNTPGTPMDVLEALDRLRRRSIIEQGQLVGSFTLQSVVLEYATARLIAEASREIEQGHLMHLIEYGLCLAQTKEYVRKAQENLLVVPLLALLQSTSQEHADVEARVLSLLEHLRDWDQRSQGYGPANLVALLGVLRGDLRGLNLSRLALRRVSLQGVQMQDADFSGATFCDSFFTQPLDAINAIAVSMNGQYWAAASLRGDVWVWAEGGQALYRAWRAHVTVGSTLAFSSDGRALASGGWDNAVKLWNVASGMLLWTGQQIGSINSVAFAPDGHVLASGGGDTLIQLWNSQSGANVLTLAGEGGTVCSLAWSPDGGLLASGCSDGNIRVWESQKAELDTHKQTLVGHTHWVTDVAFSPDGTQLASASFDGTVKLWNMDSGDCRQTLVGHTDRVIKVAWSSDGRTLASCGFDHTIRLWDAREGRVRTILHGHTAIIYCITFTPDSRTLLSGSEDGTLRVWDVDRGQCLRIIGGYTASLIDVDWSPDSTQLVSCGTDAEVMIWDRARIASPGMLRGHRWTVQGVAWSPDGRLLASAGYDGSIELWDMATRVRLQVLRNLDAIDTMFLGIAWSPDGHYLACGSYLQGVLVWDMRTRTRCWIGQTPTFIRRVAWNPDGIRLVGGGDDGYVYVWDGRDGTLQQRLAGHNGVVIHAEWSPDGRRLVSAGGGKEGGELFVWDASSGERVQTLAGHPVLIHAVTWSPDGETVISGDSNGKLRWWQVDSGACARVQEAHQGTVHALKVSPDGTELASCGNDGAIVLWDVQSGERLQTLRRDRPYERLNITGITGVTEAQKASLRALGAFDEELHPY